jgi:hypothetical protein
LPAALWSYSGMATVNPYQPPSAPVDGPLPGVRCPKCGGQGSTKVNFTWWGGALGPRLFNVIRCVQCRAQYNGKTGGKLTKTILAYQGVGLLIGVAILVLVTLLK